MENPPSISSQKFILLWSLILSLSGMALTGYSTVWGPGVFSDSVYYILSADYWVKGEGFGLPWGSGRFLPYAGNPPFYPLVVAGFELAGLGLLPAARLICILSFGGTILSAGWLSWRASRSISLAVGLSLIVLTAQPLFNLYTKAISEPVFFLTGLSGALWFLIYLETGRLSDLLPASALISAAWLTRYPGFALVLTAGTALFYLRDQLWRTRLLHAFIYILIVVLPMAIWLRWSYAQTGEFGERILAPIAEMPAKWIAFRLHALETIWQWLPWIGQIQVQYNAQKTVLGIAFVLGLGILGLLAIHHWRQPSLRQANRLLLRWVVFFGLFSLFFSMVYLLGYIFTIPTPDLNERLFSPLYIGGIFTILGILSLVNQSWQFNWILKSLPWIVVALVFSYNLPQTLQTSKNLHEDGFGYTGREWTQNPVIAALKELPPGIPIITNEADAVLFLTGRPAVWLPDVIASQPAETFARFGDSPQQLPEEIAFRERGGALVIFPSIYRQLSGLYGEQAEERLESLTAGLAVYARYGPAAAIYFYDSNFLP